jgi:hypothetical protein
MKRTILAKPVDHFGHLCDTLAAKHDQDAPARKLLPASERDTILTQGRDACLQGLLCTDSLTTLERLLECGAPLSPKLRAALAAVPVLGAKN